MREDNESEKAKSYFGRVRFNFRRLGSPLLQTYVAILRSHDVERMHELSIATGMIDQILEESASRGGLTVKARSYAFGVFAGVDKDALPFSYELACEGTPLEGSQLMIEAVPFFVDCAACKQD